MIPVSALSSYEYCSRKLYLERVLRLASENKTPLIRGSIYHQCLESFTKAEHALVLSVTKETSYDDAVALFVQRAGGIAHTHINAWQPMLIDTDLDVEELLFAVQLCLEDAARKRVREIFAFKEECGEDLYGATLWEALDPKLQSEQRLSAEHLTLSGVIDCVLRFEDGRLVPIEYKTGKAPREGVWAGHKLQVAAYAMIVEEIYGKEVSHGIIRYLDAQRDEKVYVNPALKNEIKELITKISHTLDSQVLPEKCSSERKCAVCSFKKHCYDDEFMESRLKEAWSLKQQGKQITKLSVD